MRVKPNFSSIPVVDTKSTTGQEAQQQHVEARKGGPKHVTLRLDIGDWKRIHDYALTHETSIQKLAVEGISKIMMESGLPPLRGL